jgi:hypothetical protein
MNEITRGGAEIVDCIIDLKRDVRAAARFQTETEPQPGDSKGHRRGAARVCGVLVEVVGFIAGEEALGDIADVPGIRHRTGVPLRDTASEEVNGPIRIDFRSIKTDRNHLHGLQLADKPPAENCAQA